MSKSDVGTKSLAPKAFGWLWQEAIKCRTTAEVLKDLCLCLFWVKRSQSEGHCQVAVIARESVHDV